MTLTASLSLSAAMCIALSACTFGNGMICGPQTPMAYCDHEAYQRLAHPKPYIEMWEKTGVSEDQRIRDWVGCGGASNGDFSPTIGRLKGERRPDEASYDAAHTRLQEKLKHCMDANGYHFLGKQSFTTE